MNFEFFSSIYKPNVKMSYLPVSCPAMQRILVYPIGLSYKKDYDGEIYQIKNSKLPKCYHWRHNFVHACETKKTDASKLRFMQFYYYIAYCRSQTDESDDVYCRPCSRP